MKTEVHGQPVKFRNFDSYLTCEMSGMLGKSFLIFSLALSLSLAYTVISEEELNRLSKDVEQRFFNAHKNSSETGRISKELQDFYREFRLADDPRDREFNSHSEVFSVSSKLFLITEQKTLCNQIILVLLIFLDRLLFNMSQHCQYIFNLYSFHAKVS